MDYSESIVRQNNVLHYTVMLTFNDILNPRLSKHLCFIYWKPIKSYEQSGLCLKCYDCNNGFENLKHRFKNWIYITLCEVNMPPDESINIGYSFEVDF